MGCCYKLGESRDGKEAECGKGHSWESRRVDEWFGNVEMGKSCTGLVEVEENYKRRILTREKRRSRTLSEFIKVTEV